MSSKKRVLIVDDDTSILEALELTFQSFGYQTKTLASAEEILVAIKSYKPDVIILDVLLSGVDGKVVCSNLKANKEVAGIPVIMVSAHPDLRKSAESCGADDYLEKPFDLDNLIQKVEKYT
jgi:DNA-binding response OmpR family regulator